MGFIFVPKRFHETRTLLLKLGFAEGSARAILLLEGQQDACAAFVLRAETAAR